MLNSSIVRLKEFLANHPEGGAFVAVLAVYLGFALGTDHFMTARSTISMLTLASEVGIVALGVGLLMIAGEFDLSVGSVWGFTSICAALMMKAGVASPIAMGVVLIMGVAIGVAQGFAVVKFRVHAFVITLGTMMFLRGINYAMVEAPVYVNRKDPFFKIFNYRFESGLWMTTLWFLGVTVILFFILHRTRFGNWIFATGGNKQAAIQAGVPVDRVKVILFGLCSGLATLAGLAQLTRFSAIHSGRGFLTEMFAIAMVVMGGTRLSGGYGSVMGVVSGVFLLAIIQNGLSLSGVPGYYYQGAVGMVILIAVTVNITSQKRALGGRNE